MLEPSVFRDGGWLGQRLVRASGSVAGTTLTISGQDVGLDAAGVGAGSVVLVNQVGYEVVQRLSATQATISRARGDAAGPVLPPSPVTGAAVEVVTFEPQIALTEEQVLRMVGIEPTAAGVAVDASMITNPGALRRLVALGALHLVYAAGSMPLGDASPLAARARLYRERFAEERERVVVDIDIDGDGLADARRRPNASWLVRG